MFQEHPVAPLLVDAGGSPAGGVTWTGAAPVCTRCVVWGAPGVLLLIESPKNGVDWVQRWNALRYA